MYTRADFEALFDYVNRWKLSHPMFTVLTPFPGTDYYERVRGQLTTSNYELFDLFHAVVPTQLPLKEFYAEYHRLWRRVYSFKNVLSRMRQGKLAVSLPQILGFRSFLGDLQALATRGQ
jgi:hypothetical protein